MLPIILNTIFTRHRKEMAKANEKSRAQRPLRVKPSTAEAAAPAPQKPDDKAEKA